MSRLTRRRSKAEEEFEVNVIPIMNMFLVLIPFLLLSVSFYHLKAIKTSVPVQGESQQGDAKVNDIKVTVIAEIKRDSIDLSAASEQIRSEEMDQWKRRMRKEQDKEYPFDQMAVFLQEIKEIYPASDTIIIIPDQAVIYDTIIQAMDAARYSQSRLALFPNVVLSGKVG
jgi:biopolymer transport protein ExbD